MVADLHLTSIENGLQDLRKQSLAYFTTRAITTYQNAVRGIP
jgi:hypothetical protein